MKNIIKIFYWLILIVLVILIIINFQWLTIQGFWRWNGWNALSVMVLAFTFVAIAYQVREAKKFTRFTVMPTSYFILRSARVDYNLQVKELAKLGFLPDKDIPNNFPLEDKLATTFIVINNSKFPIWFYVKISFIVQGKKQPTLKHHWTDPLKVYPGIGLYPQVFELKSFINKIDPSKNDKTIIANFEYKYCPVFAKDQISDTMPDKWTFNLEKFEWVGSNGVRDIGMTNLVNI